MKPGSVSVVLVVVGFCFGLSKGVGAGRSAAPSLSEVVFFGIRSVTDLDPDNYPSDRRRCLQRYLRAIPSDSALRLQKHPVHPEETVRTRRQNLQEQIVILIGRSAEAESKTFAAAVPISLEWEGMSEGPLEETDLARQWLERNPASAPSSFSAPLHGPSSARGL